MQLPLITTRDCGSCSACCRAMAVPSIGKPALTGCRHVFHQLYTAEIIGDAAPPSRPGIDCGCEIYASRPKECADFQCCWLEGFFKPKDRPDLLGVVFSRSVRASRPAILAIEDRPRALDKKRSMEILAAFLSQGLAVHRIGFQ
jgi:hypothetical protein